MSLRFLIKQPLACIAYVCMYGCIYIYIYMHTSAGAEESHLFNYSCRITCPTYSIEYNKLHVSIRISTIELFYIHSHIQNGLLSPGKLVPSRSTLSETEKKMSAGMGPGTYRKEKKG